MITSNQITPGMILSLNQKIYRVESCVKVTVTKGSPFIKTKLKDLVKNELIEKNFKLGQAVEEVSLNERHLDFLYPEGKDYLFLNTDNLDTVLVPADIVGEQVHFLKEGIGVKALFYGDSIYSIELPQFLELMVLKADSVESSMHMSEATKKIILETGAEIDAPLYIESGDIIKVDPAAKEFIQRI